MALCCFRNPAGACEVQTATFLSSCLLTQHTHVVNKRPQRFIFTCTFKLDLQIDTACIVQRPNCCRTGRIILSSAAVICHWIKEASVVNMPASSSSGCLLRLLTPCMIRLRTPILATPTAKRLWIRETKLGSPAITNSESQRATSRNDSDTYLRA